MAISKLSFLVSSLLLCCVTQAQLGQLGASRRKFADQSKCRIDRLNTLRPSQRIQSEAGVTEYYDESEDQLECAGVSVHRNRIEPNGLLLPAYSNSPRLIYILRGRGITGAVITGCPETFQELQRESDKRYRGGREREEEYGEQRFRDEHQRIEHFRQGDILAIPAGVPHWCYNDGKTPVEAIVVSDIANNANQLDPTFRDFMLAGRLQHGSGRFRREEGEREGSVSNILSGFDPELLSKAIGVSRETVQKLQSRNDERGHIVRVERHLQILRPSRMEEREERGESEERREREEIGERGERGESEERGKRGEREERREREERGERGAREYDDKMERSINGLDEAICSLKIRENIGEPMKADVYKPNGGRITFLNSQKLPILKYIQMSANRGVLHRVSI